MAQIENWHGLWSWLKQSCKLVLIIKAENTETYEKRQQQASFELCIDRKLFLFYVRFHTIPANPFSLLLLDAQKAYLHAFASNATHDI